MSKKLDGGEIEGLKSAIGGIIEIIPGKAEWGLIVDVESGAELYFGGVKEPAAAFVDVRVHGKCPAEKKEEFVRKLYSVMDTAAGVTPERVYINFLELDSWGAFGELRY
jgi:phenylpyruvate tautomerase PptA (4-oxalocrotonate tautomerase family)